jgi:hypothetical protein
MGKLLKFKGKEFSETKTYAKAAPVISISRKRDSEREARIQASLEKLNNMMSEMLKKGV